MAHSPERAIGKRIKQIREALGPWRGKALPRDRFAHMVGVNPSTIKKWENGDVKDIGSDNVRKLAELADCEIEWVLTGQGREPKSRPAIAREPVPDSYLSERKPGRASSEPPEPLSAEQIAEEVGEVLEPLVLLLAAKGESVVARWLLSVAAEANDQSVDNVKPLIDLARDFLWRAERLP